MTPTERGRRPLTERETRQLTAMLRAHPMEPARGIAERAGVSPDTVRAHRRRLERDEGLVSLCRVQETADLPWPCFTCECGAAVVGIPPRCSLCRAADVERRMAA